MKFNKNEIVKKNTVVHCETEQEAIELLTWACSVGLTWNFGISYLEHTHYDTYTNTTCYNLNDGTFSGLCHFKNEGYNIIKFKDLKDLKDTEMTKHHLKTGMVVEMECGHYGLVMGNAILDLSSYQKSNGGCNLIEYHENLIHIDDTRWTINKVYAENNDLAGAGMEFYIRENKSILGELIWKRKPEEMTIEEVCKALGKLIKIVEE